MTERKTVLVIDDEEAIRDAFQLAFKPLPHRIALARTGEEGLRIAARESPDLVFLDLRLPGANGVDVLRELRAVGSFPVYLVTAHEADYALQLTRANASHVKFQLCRKPLDLNDIRLITETVLSIYPGDRALPSGANCAMRVYVSGKELGTIRAYHELRNWCVRHFGDDAVVQLVDVLDEPALAEREQIFATPTVIRYRPSPARRTSGGLDDLHSLLVDLELSL